MVAKQQNSNNLKSLLHYKPYMTANLRETCNTARKVVYKISATATSECINSASH